MAMHNLPDFKIDKENPENGIKDLIRIIKPSWKPDKINIQNMSGGYSSKIFRCFENDVEDTITVRIRNVIETLTAWKPNDIEVKAIAHLSVLGHFPTLHATFANGYCYQYIPGKPVANIPQKTGYINEEILQAIAKEMAFIHSVQLPNTEYKQTSYFHNMKGMILQFPYKPKHKFAPSKEGLLKEFDIVEEYISALNMPLSLCHGDSHPGNYVWNDSTKSITFVDWELSDIGYPFYDIGYLITWLKMLDPLVSPAMKLKLPDDFENKLLKFYFSASCTLKNENTKECSFDDFKSSVKKFMLIPSLGYVTFPLFFGEVFEDFAGPGNRLYETAVNNYLNLKKELLGSNKFEE